MDRTKEFAGRKRGKLTVLDKVEDNPDKAKEKWRVYCECGTIKTIVRAHFSGLRSCGCLHRSRKRIVNYKTRRMADSTLLSDAQKEVYKTWVSIHERCSKKRSQLYPTYGARGIVVSAEWNDFFAFWQDMGPKPGPEYSIERENVNDGYHKENCKWLLKSQQGLNTTRTVRILYQGVVETLKEFIERTAFQKKDFAVVTEERKKNGNLPVDITAIVFSLCQSRGWKIPESLK